MDVQSFRSYIMHMPVNVCLNYIVFGITPPAMQKCVLTMLLKQISTGKGSIYVKLLAEAGVFRVTLSDLGDCSTQQVVLCAIEVPHCSVRASAHEIAALLNVEHISLQTLVEKFANFATRYTLRSVFLSDLTNKDSEFYCRSLKRIMYNFKVLPSSSTQSKKRSTKARQSLCRIQNPF